MVSQSLAATNAITYRHPHPHTHAHSLSLILSHSPLKLPILFYNVWGRCLGPPLISGMSHLLWAAKGVAATWTKLTPNSLLMNELDARFFLPTDSLWVLDSIFHSFKHFFGWVYFRFIPFFWGETCFKRWLVGFKWLKFGHFCFFTLFSDLLCNSAAVDRKKDFLSVRWKSF